MVTENTPFLSQAQPKATNHSERSLQHQHLLPHNYLQHQQQNQQHNDQNQQQRQPHRPIPTRTHMLPMYHHHIHHPFSSSAAFSAAYWSTSATPVGSFAFFLRTTSIRAMINHSCHQSADRSKCPRRAISISVDSTVSHALKVMASRDVTAVSLHSIERAYCPESDELMEEEQFRGMLNILDILRYAIERSESVDTDTLSDTDILGTPVSLVAPSFRDPILPDRLPGSSPEALQPTASRAFPTDEDPEGRLLPRRILDGDVALLDLVTAFRSGSHWVLLRDRLPDHPASPAAPVRSPALQGHSPAVRRRSNAGRRPYLSPPTVESLIVEQRHRGLMGRYVDERLVAAAAAAAHRHHHATHLRSSASASGTASPVPISSVVGGLTTSIAANVSTRKAPASHLFPGTSTPNSASRQSSPTASTSSLIAPSITRIAPSRLPSTASSGSGASTPPIPSSGLTASLRGLASPPPAHLGALGAFLSSHRDPSLPGGVALAVSLMVDHGDLVAFCASQASRFREVFGVEVGVWASGVVAADGDAEDWGHADSVSGLTVPVSCSAADAVAAMLGGGVTEIGCVDDEGRLVDQLGVSDLAVGLAAGVSLGLGCGEFRRIAWRGAPSWGVEEDRRSRKRVPSAAGGMRGMVGFVDVAVGSSSASIASEAWGADGGKDLYPARAPAGPVVVARGMTVGAVVEKMVTAGQQRAWIVDAEGRPIASLTMAEIVEILAELPGSGERA
ncbi:hypothetical protein HK101_006050 [Irineochytrium annulatum]|nr:hypothetical protein HK101_006050 [Irineochytrium annulatum]